jgi:hypothetical protein
MTISLKYLISTPDECSNIDALLPSKYLGEVGFDGSFTHSIQRHENEDNSWACKLFDANYDIQFLKNDPTIQTKSNYAYAYEALIESDLIFFSLSMTDYKILTYAPEDKDSLNIFDGIGMKIFNLKRLANSINRVTTESKDINRLNELNEKFKKMMKELRDSCSPIVLSADDEQIFYKIINDSSLLLNRNPLIPFYQKIFKRKFSLRY